MSEIQKDIEQPNSVEISVNAKNQMSGKVKVYAPTIEEAWIKAEEYCKKLNTKISEHNFSGGI